MGTHKNRILSVMRSFVLVFLIIIVPCKLYSMSLSFTWDANTEPDVGGYRIFTHTEGGSYDYNNPAWEGTATTCTIYDTMKVLTLMNS